MLRKRKIAGIDDHGEIGAATRLIRVIDWIVKTFLKVSAKRGGKMRELKAGESDYTAPNVVHWHGAAPKEPLVQINVGFSGGSKWYEAVTDDQYNGK